MYSRNNNVLQSDFQTIDFCHKKAFIPEGFLKKELEKRFDNFRFFPQKIIKTDDIKINDHRVLLTTVAKESMRFILYLTKYNGVNFSILIDYSNIFNLKYYLVVLNFNNKLYRNGGTIFNGELLCNDRNCWIYFVTNIYQCMGDNVFNNSLQTKIKIIFNILKNDYIYDDFLNPFHIQSKGYFPLNRLEMIKKDMTLMLVPENTYDNIYVFDIKVEKEENKKHFEEEIYTVVKGEKSDIYKIYKNNKFLDILYIKTQKESLDIQELFENKKSLELVCSYDSEKKLWYLKK